MDPGDVIDGKYRVDAMIGEGGMARVLAATHVKLGAVVAIKLLKTEVLTLPDIKSRFLREARAASRLRNDHIAKVIDVGELPTGEPYLVMEMLYGSDLGSQLDQSAIPVPRACNYIIQACEGLAEPHASGMIHRDVKPANLFVAALADGTPLIKLLDFGIATPALGDTDHSLTRTQSSMGSPNYMSPEQLKSARDVDARADIWSLGATLYELISGRVPFSASSLSGLSIQIAMEPHAPLTGVPPLLGAVVDRCLAKSPKDRYAGVAELADALAPFAIDGPAAAARVHQVLGRATPLPAHAKTHVASQSTPTLGEVSGQSLRITAFQSRRGLWIALGALVAIAAGIAVVVAMSSSSSSSTVAAKGPLDAAMVAPPAPPPDAENLVRTPKRFDRDDLVMPSNGLLDAKALRDTDPLRALALLEPWLRDNADSREGLLLRAECELALGRSGAAVDDLAAIAEPKGLDTSHIGPPLVKLLHDEPYPKLERVIDRFGLRPAKPATKPAKKPTKRPPVTPKETPPPQVPQGKQPCKPTDPQCGL